VVKILPKRQVDSTDKEGREEKRRKNHSTDERGNFGQKLRVLCALGG
jgi:hypothetical protein